MAIQAEGELFGSGKEGLWPGHAAASDVSAGRSGLVIHWDTGGVTALARSRVMSAWVWASTNSLRSSAAADRAIGGGFMKERIAVGVS